MPSYGTPPPFPAMYPHGGIYSIPPVCDEIIAVIFQQKCNYIYSQYENFDIDLFP
jgi:hypothetical protein